MYLMSIFATLLHLSLALTRTFSLPKRDKNSLTQSENPTAPSTPLPPLRILPLGDSLTLGTGSTHGCGYRLPLYTSLTSLSNATVSYIGSLSNGTGLPPNNSNHEGHSRWTIAFIGDAARENYALKPNVVLLLAGTNDIVKDLPASSAEPTLMRFLMDLTGALPDAVVLVGTLPPMKRRLMWTYRRQRYNKEVEAVVAKLVRDGERVALVNMGGIGKKMLVDGLHLNDEGYEVMAKAWEEGILKAVTKGWIGDMEAISQEVSKNTKDMAKSPERDERDRVKAVFELGLGVLMLAAVVFVGKKVAFGAVGRYKLLPQSPTAV